MNRPKFSQAKLLLWWVVYFALYTLTERLIPVEVCHLIHSPLDDKIPFCEWFAVFYVGWYGLIVFSLLWFLFRDQHRFCQLQTYIILVQLMATAVYIIYPSRQDLRPVQFPRENILTDLVKYLYRIDTPTGVFPSLHVAISIAIGSSWVRDKTASLWLMGGISVFCIMVVLSVCFVKQHSVLDVLGAIPVCLIAEWLVFYSRQRLDPPVSP